MESSPLTSYQQLLPELDEQLPTDSTDGALINDVYLQMGIDVEARWISEEVGYGIFALKEVPSGVLVTTYDGPRVNCRTGEILFECPFKKSIPLPNILLEVENGEIMNASTVSCSNIRTMSVLMELFPRSHAIFRLTPQFFKEIRRSEVDAAARLRFSLSQPAGIEIYGGIVSGLVCRSRLE
jgi:hypothetical protein